MPNADLDIVIINHNTRQLTVDCVESIERTKGSLNVSIIVVDNASHDDSVSHIQKHLPEVSLIHLDANLGYGAAANAALHRCKAQSVIVCNSDVIFQPYCLAQLAATIQKNPLVGVVGPQQFYLDGSWQRSYGLLPGIGAALCDALGGTFVYRRIHRQRSLSTAPQTSLHRAVQYVDGAIMCFRREALESIHGFDERFYFFCEDADICHALHKNGWKVVTQQAAHAIHLRGATRSTSVAADLRYLGNNLRARYMFIRKYQSALTARLTAAIESAYYAEIMIAHLAASMFRNTTQRVAHRQKADLCRHLISICAEEMESND